MSKSVEQKIFRLAQGKPPRVLDLFAGCGGMALGFMTAGCQSLGGLEIDADAAMSFALNFHGGNLDLHGKARDINTTEPARFLQELGHEEPERAVDILVGGPPCPTFTRVGRAKLREVQRHPEAYRHDPRAQLYIPYLHFVKVLQPIAVVMENVPDILNWGGHNLGEEICDVLEGMGYRCAYSLLNAASYGVPQMRERFVLIALRKELRSPIEFPRPTHEVSFPSGYKSSRLVALKPLLSKPLFMARSRYCSAPCPVSDARNATTVEEAIGDLPVFLGHLDGSLRRGARRFDKAVGYRQDVEPSLYALLMREWPGFEGSGKIWDHVIRSLSERDYRLFRAMKHGDDYPRAYSLASRLFQEELQQAKKRGSLIRKGSRQYMDTEIEYVPPYDPGKFPNKWRKMEPDKPARTLMAHLGKDSYSHIHYDSAQARTISVREAARLQSFPDGFKFSGTMNPAFRQIGNAVPPLLSLAMAGVVLSAIGVSTNVDHVQGRLYEAEDTAQTAIVAFAR
jgi:DNA (cytosine-5)-methyltransferase 1